MTLCRHVSFNSIVLLLIIGDGVESNPPAGMVDLTIGLLLPANGTFNLTKYRLITEAAIRDMKQKLQDLQNLPIKYNGFFCCSVFKL